MIRIVLAVAAVLTMSACTIPGMGGTQTSTPPATTPATTTATTTATQTAPPTAPPSADAVLASRATAYGGKKAKVDLNQVIVTADVTTVTWTLTNTSDEDKIELVGGLYKDTSIFSDGRAATVPGSDAKVDGDLRAADGVFLVDTVNKKRYLAARDSTGVCLCSTTPRWEMLEPGASMPYSATYRAIPEGVETVNVSIPGVGTFVRVAVQR
jgi:hypothetical protein